MRTIWGFDLDITNDQIVTCKHEITPLTVQVQGSRVVMWCEVDTDTGPSSVTVFIAGAGHDISRVSYPSGSRYLNTFQLEGSRFIGGRFIGHVYVSFQTNNA